MSQYPGLDVIKNVEIIIYKQKSDIMSLLGHDDIIFQVIKMMSWFILIVSYPYVGMMSLFILL